MNKHVNDDKGVAVQAGAVKNPKGAIPLSIFGEEEGKEEEKPASVNVFSNGDGSAVKRGSSSNGSVGINDLISSLYNQQRPQVDSHNNESVSVSNVVAPNLTYSNESKLNSDEDEDGWEFKSTEWETGTKSQDVKAKTPKHDNGALDVGHINPQPSPESESNDIGTGFAMFSQYFGEFSSGSGPNQNLKLEMDDGGYYSTTTSLSSSIGQVMSPKSPLFGLVDFHGKRKQMVKIQVLEREIGLFQGLFVPGPVGLHRIVYIP
ncbi:hypothetical protein D0Y65_046220 [Glycine soja]|uniref:Uncharacterized protein n=1 Tax=Glycine soja TaxID=3848 RepID=A0A445G8E7_GLYSO|nr:hypothetical protein D0Y65_046220 [Glycine soja]